MNQHHLKYMQTTGWLDMLSAEEIRAESSCKPLVMMAGGLQNKQQETTQGRCPLAGSKKEIPKFSWAVAKDLLRRRIRRSAGTAFKGWFQISETSRRRDGGRLHGAMLTETHWHSSTPSASIQSTPPCSARRPGGTPREKKLQSSKTCNHFPTPHANCCEANDDSFSLSLSLWTICKRGQQEGGWGKERDRGRDQLELHGLEKVECRKHSPPRHPPSVAQNPSLSPPSRSLVILSPSLDESETLSAPAAAAAAASLRQEQLEGEIELERARRIELEEVVKALWGELLVIEDARRKAADGGTFLKI